MTLVSSYLRRILQRTQGWALDIDPSTSGGQWYHIVVKQVWDGGLQVDLSSTCRFLSYQWKVDKHQAARKGWSKVGAHQQPLLVHLCQPTAVPVMIIRNVFCLKHIWLVQKHVNLMINIWRKADTLKEPIQRPIEATRASMWKKS